MALTSKLLIGLAEMYMFFLLRSQETLMGSIRNNEEIISDCTTGGADAVSAMNGASIRARNPPIVLKDSLKPVPLSIIII